VIDTFSPSNFNADIAKPNVIALKEKLVRRLKENPKNKNLQMLNNRTAWVSPTSYRTSKQRNIIVNANQEMGRIPEPVIVSKNPSTPSDIALTGRHNKSEAVNTGKFFNSPNYMYLGRSGFVGAEGRYTDHYKPLDSTIVTKHPDHAEMYAGYHIGNKPSETTYSRNINPSNYSTKTRYIDVMNDTLTTHGPALHTRGPWTPVIGVNPNKHPLNFAKSKFDAFVKNPEQFNSLPASGEDTTPDIHKIMNIAGLTNPKLRGGEGLLRAGEAETNKVALLKQLPPNHTNPSAMKPRYQILNPRQRYKQEDS
jgi:hypothetical protein